MPNKSNAKIKLEDSFDKCSPQKKVQLDDNFAISLNSPLSGEDEGDEEEPEEEGGKTSVEKEEEEDKEPKEVEMFRSMLYTPECTLPTII